MDALGVSLWISLHCRQELWTRGHTYSQLLSGAGTSWAPSQVYDVYDESQSRIFLAWSRMGLVHVIPASVSEFICAMVLSCQVILAGIHCLWFLWFFAPSSMMTLDPHQQESNTVISFRAEHATVSYSLHIGQLGVFVLITIYCKQNLPWWALRDALICRHKVKNLFSK